MQEPGLHRTGSFTIYGLGRWSGGRPVFWIRAAAFVISAGYATAATFHLAVDLPPARERAMEVTVAVAAAAAFLLGRRRPVLASVALVAAIGAEALLSLVWTPDPSTGTLIVVPAMVLAFGLLFGDRAALASAAVAAVAVPAALAASGRYGALLQGLTTREASRLVVFEAATLGTGFIAWLALKTFARVLGEAEERRRLELHLEQVQRLELVGMLASGFAHDFKNVLGVVRGSAGVLATSDDAVARQVAVELGQAGESGTAAVRQLLDLARRDEPAPGVVDVAGELQRMRQMVARLLGPGHRLRLEAAGPALTRIDPARLEQVVLNLTANARDAMPGGGSVSVGASVVDREAAAALGSTVTSPRQVLLEVRDEGPGVPEALAGRLFEPFVTTRPRGAGTGLGLAAVRSAATASGGAVSAANLTPRGAAFRVFLPEASA